MHRVKCRFQGWNLNAAQHPKIIKLIVHPLPKEPSFQDFQLSTISSANEIFTTPVGISRTSCPSSSCQCNCPTTDSDGQIAQRNSRKPSNEYTAVAGRCYLCSGHGSGLELPTWQPGSSGTKKDIEMRAYNWCGAPELGNLIYDFKLPTVVGLWMIYRTNMH